MIHIYGINANEAKTSHELLTFQDSLHSYEKVEELLVCRLIAKESNMKYLRQGPYKMHQLGAVALFVEGKGNEEGSPFVHVTHQLAELWNQPQEKLFDTALRNTFEHDRPTFAPLNELLSEETRRCAGIEIIVPEEKPLQYVLTNSKRVYGATMILYPNIMKDIRERMGEDYYILPSSIHELIVMPKSIDASVHELKEMVMDINRTSVAPEDFLSNNVYEYNGREDRLKKCAVEKSEPVR